MNWMRVVLLWVETWNAGRDRSSTQNRGTAPRAPKKLGPELNRQGLGSEQHPSRLNPKGAIQLIALFLSACRQNYAIVTCLLVHSLDLLVSSKHNTQPVTAWLAYCGSISWYDASTRPMRAAADKAAACSVLPANQPARPACSTY